MLREYFIEANQIKLNIAEGPTNGPALLLFPGFTNCWQVFLPILPALLPHWHVITCDYRGHGRSGRSLDGYSAGGFYEDARAVFQHIGQVPVYILGHSMGGSMGLHLAQEFPDQVKGLVTGDTSLNLDIHIDVMNARRNMRLFGLRRKIAGKPVDELLRKGLSPQAASEISSIDPAVMNYHAVGQVAQFFQNIVDIDFSKIRCPVLIAQADPAQGGILQDDEISFVKKTRPDFQFMHFNCGHDLEIDKGSGSPFLASAIEFLERNLNQ